jgi:hypothetical protein
MRTTHLLGGLATLAICFFVSATGLAAQTASERRVALIIGNADYSHVSRLTNPANDAGDLGIALERVGFSVTRHLNLDYRAMRLALRDFAEAAADADMALIYFAGHGIEIDNTNYLIPVNAELRSDRDVEFETIRLDTVIKTIADVDGLKLILIDACRNNPFLTSMQRTTTTRSVGRGLGRIDPGGVLVGYAARGGTLALDGEGRNSPYAQALLRHIEEPGLELGKMFRKIRDTVFDLTDGAQEPFTYGSLPGDDIYLLPPLNAASATEPSAVVTLTVMQRMLEDFSAANTANKAADWTRFINRYANQPDKRLLKIAMERRDALKREAALKKAPALPAPAAVAPVTPGPEPQASAEPPLAPVTDSVAVSTSVARSIQSALNGRGFDAGTADGILGPRSRRAIAAFQAASNLPATGAITGATLAALAIDPSQPPVSQERSISALKARSYSSADVARAGNQARLRRVVRGIGGRQIVYGYYQTRLYVAVLGNSSFDFASSLAQRLGGHLATMTTSAENTFVYDLIRHDARFWVISEDRSDAYGPGFGLYQPKGSAEPRGGWRWVTGEPFRYNRWGKWEPNDFNGREDLATFTHWTPGNRRMKGLETASTWNDSPGMNTGFIMEFE